MDFDLASGAKATSPNHPLGILRQSGCNVRLVDDNSVHVSFEHDVMHSSDVSLYAEMFRGYNGWKCEQVSRDLEITGNPNPDVRDIAIMIASKASQRNDLLGKAFEERLLDLQETTVVGTQNAVEL